MGNLARGLEKSIPNWSITRQQININLWPYCGKSNPVKSDQPLAHEHNNSRPAQKTTCRPPPRRAGHIASAATGEGRHKARTQITSIKSAIKQDLALSGLRHDTRLIKPGGPPGGEGLAVSALAVSSGTKVMHKEGLVAFVGSHYSLTVWQL